MDAAKLHPGHIHHIARITTTIPALSTPASHRQPDLPQQSHPAFRPDRQSQHSNSASGPPISDSDSSSAVPTVDPAAAFDPSRSLPSPTRQHQQWRESRRVRPDRSSLRAYAATKGFFSVTELVGPTWCEYQYQYGIFGLSYLPASLRPLEVTLPSGAVLKPNLTVAKEMDEMKALGSEIHKKLEEEAHPQRVFVDTKSREDDWALTLLNLIIGLRTLIDGGCVRELPVFGWVEDHLVSGVIDEIERLPLHSRKAHQPILTAHPRAPLTLDHPKLPFPPTPQTKDMSSTRGDASESFPHLPDSRSMIRTQWASQEEWKEWKTRERKSATRKSQTARWCTRGNGRPRGSALSSQGSKDVLSGAEYSQKSPGKRTLKDFFGTQKVSADEVLPISLTSDSQSEVEGLSDLESATFSLSSRASSASSSPPPSKSPNPLVSIPRQQIPPNGAKSSRGSQTVSNPQRTPFRFGYFLSDTKTRRRPSIPPISHQRSARLQTMLYKRLLDGLCLGAVLRAPEYSLQKRREWSENRQHVEMVRQQQAGLTLDLDARPVDMHELFVAYNLDDRKPLSDAFLRDAEVLLDGLPKHDHLQRSRSEPTDPDTAESDLSGVRTLADLAKMTDTALLELVRSARQQAGLSTRPKQMGRLSSAAIQSSLRIAYHVQGNKVGKWKRHRERGKTDTATEMNAPLKADIRTFAMYEAFPDGDRSAAIASQKVPADYVPRHDEDEEAQLIMACQMSLDTQVETRGPLESIGKGSLPLIPPYRHVASLPPQSSLSTGSSPPIGSSEPVQRRSQRLAMKAKRNGDGIEPRQPGDGLATAEAGEGDKIVDPTQYSAKQRFRSADASPDPPAFPPSLGKGKRKGDDGGDPSLSFPSSSSSSLIGIVRHDHSSRHLSTHLHSILDFWLQLRSPQGVPEEETWKCNACEWREGCEWRWDRGEEKANQMIQARRARSGGGGGDAEVGVGAGAAAGAGAGVGVELKARVEGGGKTQAPLRRGEVLHKTTGTQSAKDSDEDLWSLFDDPPTEVLDDEM